MMMKAVAALLPNGSTRVTGKIEYRLPDGSWQDLLKLPYKERHEFVSERVAVIFQDSIHALNPNERIAKQWGDTVKLHHPGVSKEERERHLLRQMEVFGIRGGADTLRSYPHQLSGGSHKTSLMADTSRLRLVRTRERAWTQVRARVWARPWTRSRVWVRTWARSRKQLPVTTRPQ